MDDEAIVDLYWARDQRAIAETEKSHGAACRAVARRILPSREDGEECLSDTWLRAWNSIPPQRPVFLRAFLAKITRNLALNRLEANGAEKRGGGEVPLALDELRDCLPGGDPGQQVPETLVLTQTLNRFLKELPEQQRVIFLRRYFYLCPVRDIAAGCGLSESAVKMSLLRARQTLKKLLEQEGVPL